jgi:hypothetical protein
MPIFIKLPTITREITLEPTRCGLLVNVQDAASGAFIGLIRDLTVNGGEGFRAHGVDGWEGFETVELAAAAVVRRAEARW